MSFPVLMVLLVVVTGLVWLIDRLIFVPKRKPDQKEPVLVEYARSFFPIILLVLVIRSFVAEPFRIPSASMLPTLHVGDFILVNKFSYGVRLPVTHTRIFSTGTPKHGDVMVFRYPRQPEVDYIKRVIGLPGDKIGYFNKVLYLNGQPVLQAPAPRPAELTGFISSRAEMRQETLADKPHHILVEPDSVGAEGEIIVPEGHYFVMGDNRDNSNDSRMWGAVPEENLVGKAFLIWMSWDNGIVWSRLGRSID